MAKKLALDNTVKPQFKMRSQQVIFHHLFKALLQKFAKNLSWQKGIVKLDMIEHVHHFHSVNSHGMPQTYTTAVGGHFHAVTWEIGENGEPVAKCGPPLKKVTVNTPRGTRTTNEPLKWFDEEAGHWLEDNHVHEMQYMGTDEISTKFIQDKMNATAIKEPAFDGLVENDR